MKAAAFARAIALIVVGLILGGALGSGVDAGNFLTRARAKKLFVQGRNFQVKLTFGESKTVARHGTVSLEAVCRKANTGGGDIAILELVAATTADGAFMDGDAAHEGPGVGSTHLNVTTDYFNRIMGAILTRTDVDSDSPAAAMDVDTGFVLDPNGKAIQIDETTVYALNTAGSDCMMSGYYVKTG